MCKQVISANENSICALNGTEQEILQHQGVSYLNGEDGTILLNETVL